MSIAITLLWQIIMMFLLVGVGYLLFRSGKITAEGSKTLGNILIFISLPCVIINGFLVERTAERLTGLWVSSLAAAVALLISILVSTFFFRKNGISVFGSSFSNPGFFGIPLILSCIGNDAVFYVASFIAFLNLGQWTYGVFVMTGQKGALSPGKILKAPFMVAILIGLFLFFTGIEVPDVIGKCLTHLSNINTPLAMFTIGVYLAQTDIKAIFKTPGLYGLSAVRLLLIPVLSLLVLSLIPASFSDMKLALLIVASCPVGSNVAVYAQLHNQDYRYAVQIVVVSTLLSVVTMPLIVQLAAMLWQIG